MVMRTKVLLSTIYIVEDAKNKDSVVEQDQDQANVKLILFIYRPKMSILLNRRRSMKSPKLLSPGQLEEKSPKL